METTKWYYLQDGQPRGPVSLQTLVGMMKDGVFSKENPVSPHCADEWRPLHEVLSFLRFDFNPHPRRSRR
jgi:hypothetical protein